MRRRIWTGGTAPTHLSSTWRRTGTREVSMTSFRTRGTISRDTMKSGTNDQGCAAVHARRRPSHSSGEHGSAGRMLRTGSPHGLHAELGADKPKRAAVEAFDDRAGALRAAANDLGLCATETHPPSTRGAQSRSSLFAARAEDTAVCSQVPYGTMRRWVTRHDARGNRDAYVVTRTVTTTPTSIIRPAGGRHRRRST